MKQKLGLFPRQVENNQFIDQIKMLNLMQC